MALACGKLRMTGKNEGEAGRVSSDLLYTAAFDLLCTGAPLI